MALSWEKVEGFLNHPGERWVRAYEKLGPSEKTLLLSLLDSGGREQVDRARATYEERISYVQPPRLPWSDCVRRLAHSFLSTGTTYFGREYIDYQHPSLRDMLLTHLRNEPTARRRYIELAGPTALANIIQGASAVSRDPAGGQRFLMVHGPEERQLLLDKLRAVCNQPLTPEVWQSILASVELLIPRRVRPTSTGSSRATQPLVSPAELDLEDFAKSWEGKVVSAVVEVFSSQTTFESNRRYLLQHWMQLIEAYYRLAAFVIPPRHLPFIFDIVRQFPATPPEDAIAYSSIIHRSDPLVIRQTISREKLAAWRDYISEKVAELIATGEFLDNDPPDDPEEASQIYDNWHDDVEMLLGLRDFYGWSGFSQPEEIGELEVLFDTVAVLPEPDYADDDWDRERQKPTAYWTIDTIFADL